MSSKNDFRHSNKSGETMAKNKKKKWTRFRHKVVTEILRFSLGTYSRVKYSIKVRKFKEQEKKTPYLVLMNHQTAFDQFFIGMAFKGPIYYLASEDIFSNGWISSLIRYLVAPIPIKKQTTDIKAILNCIRVSKEGGTIAIAPEGNRTYSGRTEYMSPSIVPLARKLGMPIALFRIEGGYGVHPRWSDVVRKGKMTAYVSRVISPAEYADMSDEELFEAIKSELYVNEAVADASFKHKKRAEYLERAIYICPDCGFSSFESHNDTLECTKCHKKVLYTNKKELVGIDHECKFSFVADWYDYQKDFISSTDITAFSDTPVYVENVKISEVIPYKNKELICKNASISLFGNRILVKADKAEFTFGFDDTFAVTVLGKNKLDIYYDGHIYQIKGSCRFNALKYVHFYNRYRNIVKGDQDGKFLGL
ncbi:MAG: 1-acyl-sn-glycerol-3-phosphate acyltransferase [Ruminococcaceae bacterium]|nr:1-acyl-sn-glycerol-3-phosphate acyltransferase [Oscillospiraceae bacterium]